MILAPDPCRTTDWTEERNSLVDYLDMSRRILTRTLLAC